MDETPAGLKHRGTYDPIPRRRRALQALAGIPGWAARTGEIEHLYVLEEQDANERARATFHIEELPAILEADWRADERRAVAGLSMGGFGAMSYAARYPGHFRSAATYSGGSTRSAPTGSTTTRSGVTRSSSEIWEAHDPVTLAAALEGTPLYVSWGDGREEEGGPVIDGLEEWLAPHSEAFVARLDDLGIPATVESGIGTHTWDTWNPAFESSLPMLLESLED